MNIKVFLLLSFILLVVLNCIDLLTTYYGLTYLPIIEKNPLFADQPMYYLIAVKFILISIMPVFFMVFLNIMDRLAWAHKVIIPVMLSLNMLYMYVCIGNLDLIIAWS